MNESSIKAAAPRILTINGGSSSIKFALFEAGDSLARILEGAIERIGLPDGVVKIVGVSDDHEAVARAEKDAQKECGQKASATRSQPYYLDITHPDANKGAVVTRLSELLAVPGDRIATIGDGPNDVLMFRRSGLSIAVGNAGDEVKAAAGKVTASNEEEGFAQAMERYVLGGGE